MFLGGTFDGAQRNCTIYERKAYDVVQTFYWLDYLFWSANLTHVCTDHKNLLYVFAPLVLRPNFLKHVLSKLHWWAIHLSRFEFFINRIEGKTNVLTDILTRWSKGYSSTSAPTNLIAALCHDIIPTLLDTEPLSVTEIKREQEKYTPPTKAIKRIEVVSQMNGKYGSRMKQHAWSWR